MRSQALPLVGLARPLLAERVFVLASRLTALVLLSALLAAMSPHFLTATNLMNVLRQGALQFIMASGLTLCVLTGGIDLSVGAVLGLSACLGAALVSAGHVTAGVAAALAAGTMCGAVNGLMVAWLRLPAFIATYGMLWIAHGLGYVFMKGEVIHGFPAGFRTLGAGFAGVLPVPVLVMLGLLVCLHVLLHHTPFGRALYAIGGNPVAARLSGMPVRRHLVIAYTLSGALAAFAGLVVIARVNAADSGIGEDLLLASIAAVVLGGTSLFGGVGGVAGTAVGSLILALVVNGMNLLSVKTFWQPFVLGSIVIVSVLADQLVGRTRAGLVITS
ncbi:MAG TPA: ABC transporter permease [Methylomirabilota bacterium]|jgi:ribose transport system permease protein|nr:ABC transporter permease [Methylomirabilota bacterium]